MKRKRQRTVIIKCGACHCDSTLDVTGLSAGEIRADKEKFIVCAECDATMADLESEGKLLYFQSHFQDAVVLNSYHSAVKVSRHLQLQRRPFSLQSEEYSVAAAVALLRGAGAILILAGSGMSADSGLSTFRPTGLGASELSSGNMHLLPLEDACYSTKPEKAWYYDAGYRRSITATQPHSGYSQLLALLQRFNRPWFVVTTNIDRYFIQSGFPEDRVYETHGSVYTLQCSKRGAERCSGVFEWPSKFPLPQLNDTELSCDISTVPRCPTCGGMARMNISHLPDEEADVDSSIKASQRERAKNWIHNQHKHLVTENSRSKGSKKLPLTDKGSDGLLILEIGCGSTPHGLQSETDLLLSKHPQLGFYSCSSLVRVNPDSGEHPSHLSSEAEESIRNWRSKQCISLRRGARDVFQRLATEMITTNNIL